MKWLWRFSLEDQALWRKVICEKYGADGRWCTAGASGPYGASVWKSIRNLWPGFISNVSIKVGNGNKTSFWNDDWMGNGHLKEAFPDLFTTVQQPQATVAEVWSTQGWNVTFRRFPNDWEVTRVIEFYKLLDGFKGITKEEERNSGGVYTVKSAYGLLNSSGHMNNETWHWKHIGKVKISFKVACFCWLVVKEVVLTHDSLMRRGMLMCSKCFLCGKEIETNNHLFLHCKVTSRLWYLFMSMKGVKWAIPRTTAEIIACLNDPGIILRQAEALVEVEVDPSMYLVDNLVGEKFKMLWR
uniref:Reverse transcriptase zinc-binding domain-containing protein n=1 Tax=Nicotiana tabacum TaxID=4097 RepID=A0A1S4C8B9_TOBAC|nr:PREDICTED: uncharacterized protein LOC107816041 [Nicotiana tabacum]